MKSKNIQFFSSVYGYSWGRIIYYLAFSSLFLLPANKMFGQQTDNENLLRQKAILFKNRVEYDSALFYFEKLDVILTRGGDQKSEILNKLDIYDIFVRQRELARASSGLQDIAIKIENEYTGNIDLEAVYSQVKGSFLLASRDLDSAKYYLKRSIQIRAAKYGQQDTLLHYAYNKLGSLYYVQSNFDSAYLYFHTALDLSLRKRNPVNYEAASSYQNLGIAAHKKDDYKLAADFYTRSLELKEKLFDYNDPALAKIYGNLGKFYSDLSKYNIALDYYDKAEQLLISKYERDNIQFAYLYNNIGNVYTIQGDYIKATSYLSKAHSMLEKNLGPDSQDVLNALLDLGYAYYKKGDTLLAIEFYNIAAKNKDNAGIIKIYRNLGDIYQSINKSDSAEKYYQLSIDFAKKIFSGNSYDLALCYQYYGEFLSKDKNDPKSLWYYSQASDIFIQLFGRKYNKDLSKVFLLQGEYYIEKKEYDIALSIIQAALVTLLPEFEDLDPASNPLIENILLDLYLPYAFSLKSKALNKRYTQDKNPKDLYLNLNTINLALNAIEEIRKTYNEEESQLDLNKNARTLIDIGIMVTNELFTLTGESKYLADAFHFSEKGKAIILLSALRGLEAQSNTNIPEISRENEKNLAMDLATYNNLVYQERQKKNPDEARMQIWRDEIFNYRLSHDSILDSYKNLYPEYFRLKYDNSTISADSALMLLPDDQAILEYYITDSMVLCFLLADGKLAVEKLGLKIDLKNKLDSLHQNFTKNDFFNADQKNFETITSLSAGLYDILIRPFEDAISGKRLIIIPDGELGYLSFDLLIKSLPPDHSPDYNDVPWLIKSNPISYSSSATIHFEQSIQSALEVGGNLLAFAPSYDFDSQTRNAADVDSVRLMLGPITGTKEEINSISGLFRTKKLFGDRATETYFKKHAGEYSILHLAMHTVIDDQNPLYSKLVFATPGTDSLDDGYLNTYELFGLHLPGQLAVLSACNTGSGKLERGEGIISLARGFFYAGIPSVVMTLWEIEDHSSADLMALFYKNLKEGLPNDIALQHAKIDYLAKAGKLQSHPYFWAGYVCIGKIASFDFKASWGPMYYVLIGVSFIVIILIIYFFINRRVYFYKKRY